MAARAYWSGHLRISLVSFAVELYSATRSQATIAFHQIDRSTGKRVRHLNVIDGDKPVERSEIVKGYEYRKGEYIVVEPDEIEAVRIPTKKTIDVEQFIDVDELDPSLFETPYFVVPRPGEAGDAFAVVRKAMQQTKKAAIGEIAFGGREHLVAIAVPRDDAFKGLMAYTLRYADELREGADYMPAKTSADLDKKQLAMASELIRAYSSPFHFSEFKDDYEAALRQLLEAKQKNVPLPAEEKPSRQGKVTDLMDALRRSVTAAKKPPAREKIPTALAGRKGPAGPVLVKPHTRKRKVA